MAKYISGQARIISGLRSEIASTINENWRNLTPQNLQDITNETVDAINQIEAMLHRNNGKNKSYFYHYLVRVRDHARLGIPALPQDPKIRIFLKRLENSVHVLCVLVDAIAGEQDPAVAQEETQAITNGEQILGQLVNRLGFP